MDDMNGNQVINICCLLLFVILCICLKNMSAHKNIIGIFIYRI